MQQGTSIVKMLLQVPGIDVNKFQCDGYSEGVYTPLHFAIKNKHNEIVKLLVENPRIDVNVKSGGDKVAPIELAIMTENVEAVKLLLSCERIEINSYVYLFDILS